MIPIERCWPRLKGRGIGGHSREVVVVQEVHHLLTDFYPDEMVIKYTSLRYTSATSFVKLAVIVDPPGADDQYITILKLSSLRLRTGQEFRQRYRVSRVGVVCLIFLLSEGPIVDQDTSAHCINLACAPVNLELRKIDRTNAVLSPCLHPTACSAHYFLLGELAPFSLQLRRAMSPTGTHIIVKDWHGPIGNADLERRKGQLFLFDSYLVRRSGYMSKAIPL